ncbi:hypothetical protein LJR225_004806 [Phenylobacterium sp. LjRoot225]|uniref:hypothetical protein n=1 Tax=Phenylobacterium sp. LjRoot225 TaxID=3342285 RepID=UPI003ECEEFA9
MTFQIWNPDWFPLPGQAVFDRERQQIAAVSRAPGNLDLFVIGNDNHVWTTYWNDQVGWSADWFPLPGQAVFDRERQQVAAVSRAPGALDLFVIGNDNHVWTTYWNDQVGWSADWFPLPGRAVFDRERQQVAAVSRAPGALDLFVIGNDSHVWTTYWNDQVGWNPDWFPLPGQAVFDRERQQIAAVSRAPGALDLFVIGNDNHVWTTYWNDQVGWSADWFPLPGQAVFDRERQQVAAVSRAPGNLDLFVIGNDNHVWTTYWNDQVGWSADWFPLPGQAVFDRECQQVAAVSRASGNLDPFVIGNDSHVWTTYWNDQVGWSADWFPLPGQAVFDRERQQVAAVSRAPGALDLFVIGNDNHVWTTFWGPRAPMTLDVRIDQTSTIVPLQVGLHIAATDGIVTETNWSATKNGVHVPEVGDTIPAGVAFDRILAINDPGSYAITVNRTGLTGPSGPTTLTKHFSISAEHPAPPPPPPQQPPTISVTFSGSIQHAKFHVTGSGFLPNRPANNQGVAIRVVDANILTETRREFTRSSSQGAIDHVIEGDLTGLTVNALGVATIAISATDGRQGQGGFLWSNTARIDFPA